MGYHTDMLEYEHDLKQYHNAMAQFLTGDGDYPGPPPLRPETPPPGADPLLQSHITATHGSRSF